VRLRGRRILRGTLVALGANAAALLVASTALSGFHLSVGDFGIVLVAFTLLALFVRPVVNAVVRTYAPFLAIVGSLIAAFIVLVIADLLLRGLTIHGLKTWVVATLLIWGVGILTSLALGAYIAKSVLPDGPGPAAKK
jgi:Mycobacterial 4 TMS phage holin, superfamily IV